MVMSVQSVPREGRMGPGVPREGRMGPGGSRLRTGWDRAAHDHTPPAQSETAARLHTARPVARLHATRSRSHTTRPERDCSTHLRLASGCGGQTARPVRPGTGRPNQGSTVTGDLQAGAVVKLGRSGPGPAGPTVTGDLQASARPDPHRLMTPPGSPIARPVPVCPVAVCPGPQSPDLCRSVLDSAPGTCTRMAADSVPQGIIPPTLHDELGQQEGHIISHGRPVPTPGLRAPGPVSR